MLQYTILPSHLSLVSWPSPPTNLLSIFSNFPTPALPHLPIPLITPLSSIPFLTPSLQRPLSPVLRRPNLFSVLLLQSTLAWVEVTARYLSRHHHLTSFPRQLTWTVSLQLKISEYHSSISFRFFQNTSRPSGPLPLPSSKVVVEVILGGSMRKH